MSDPIIIKLHATFDGVVAEFNSAPASDDPLGQRPTRGRYDTLADAAKDLPRLVEVEAKRRKIGMDR